VYGLRPEADVVIDVDTFMHLIQDADQIAENDSDKALDLYEEAINLYKGEFLPETRYAVWTAVEREYLAVLYLKTADRYCELNLERRGYSKVIETCQQILAQDSCWERAYRHLMAAFDGLGDHGQVARTYQRCVEILNHELNIPPSDETEMLYQEIISSG
jgi:two-component SAPR family response regulator